MKSSKKQADKLLKELDFLFALRGQTPTAYGALDIPIIFIDKTTLK